MSDGGARVDRAIAFLLGVGYVSWLVLTAHDLGYARDEGFYFEAARAYRHWFELLFRDPQSAFSRAAIDASFSVNHEHPAFMKTAFLFSHWVLFEKLGVFAEPGTAYRFPTMLLGGLSVSVLYCWARRCYGRTPGVFAAVAFACIPRVFFHAHLACFDAPVTSLWLVTAYLYARSLESARLGWALAAGVAFGVLLDTKHNAWFLPITLGLHLLLVRGRALAHELRRWRPGVPRGFVALVVIGPLVFWLGWPWLWFDTASRFLEYARFHLHHDYYNMEFLGVTYYEPPFPRAYAWLMTLATVPLTTLVLSGIGACLAVRGLIRHFGELGSFQGSLSHASGIESLWLVALLVNYAPWWSPETPIFGGTKHWMTAYPFLCLLAARGFSAVSAELCDRARELRGRLAEKLRPERYAPGLCLFCTSVASFAMTFGSHPFGLSAYTPVVGGASGAAELGLNRTFWGYTTGSLAEFLNRRAPPGARIYLHDTLSPSFEMLRLDGRLRSDLKGTLAVERSDLALYHHEPHMGRVEYQVWAAYGTTRPSSVLTHDGVPVAWVYERPLSLPARSPLPSPANRVSSTPASPASSSADSANP